MNDKQSDALERVMDLVRHLRTHCPWDAAQTPLSLIPYLLEEAHETADAITREEDDDLRSELGDLLLNVAFQIVLGEERQAFSADEVADTVIDKMQRRHPHLYGLGDKEEWESLKARERAEGASLLEGVAPGLDPLSRAHRIQDRVAAVGFDWDDAMGAFAKVAEELEEVREQLEAVALRAADPGAAHAAALDRARPEPEGEVGVREGEAAGASELQASLEEELGDLLFAVVNLSRLAGAHALTALQGANAKFIRRFQALEALAVEQGLSLQEASLDQLEALWGRVKAGEDT